MSEYLTAGLVGSLVTIVAKSIIDCLTEKQRYNRELRKLIFQRKTDAVEKAMSWYQEAIDALSILKIALGEVTEKDNQLTSAKLELYRAKSLSLFEHASNRLNQIYLYYDFTGIERKYKYAESTKAINDAFREIYNLEIKAKSLEPGSPVYKGMETQAVQIFHSMVNYVDNQIQALVAIQVKLRSDYKQY